MGAAMSERTSRAGRAGQAARRSLSRLRRPDVAASVRPVRRARSMAVRPLQPAGRWMGGRDLHLTVHHPTWGGVAVTPARGACRPANDEQRDTLARLEAALALAQRLRPDWQRPDAFYEAKSELIACLRAIAASPLLVRQTIRHVRVEVPIERIVEVERVVTMLAPQARSRLRRRHRYPMPPAGPGGLL
jgi:hypothetical protein